MEKCIGERVGVVIAGYTSRDFTFFGDVQAAALLSGTDDAGAAAGRGVRGDHFFENAPRQPPTHAFGETWRVAGGKETCAEQAQSGAEQNASKNK